MLGFGADENAIKKKIRKCGIADNVIWTGKILDRNELLGYYGISDLLLFPSTFDTNGLVVREAAACATPSLLVRGSCAAEGVEDCKTGFLCMESAHSVSNALNNMNIKHFLKSAKRHKAIFISAGTTPLKKPMSVIMLLSIISKRRIIYNQINKISSFS